MRLMSVSLGTTASLDAALDPDPWTAAGMGKEYTIPCIDSDVLQAMVDKEDMPICAVAQASGLSRSGWSLRDSATRPRVILVYEQVVYHSLGNFLNE